MLLGNDVSQFQGDIDWDVYSKNSNFAIIRATYGNGYTDEKFLKNRDEVRRVGLPHGFYHYCYPQFNNAVDEAHWFIATIGTLQDGEILFLDFEELCWDIVGWCKTFLDTVYSLTNGCKPLMYLNQYLAVSYDWQPVVDGDYGLWIAAYTYDPNINVYQTGKWTWAAFQQWTNKQIVPGIPGPVDGDCFFGDISQFKAYGYKSSIPPTVPPTPTVPPSTPPSTPPTTTTPPPTMPPSTGNPVPSVDYKFYLLNIKEILNEPIGWKFWKVFDQIDRVKAQVESSGV